MKDELLYHRDKVLQQIVQQLCLPMARRDEVCRMAHDMCHQGYKRTKEKLRLIMEETEKMEFDYVATINVWISIL